MKDNITVGSLQQKSSIEKLEQKLEALSEQIEETKRRLPAHSTKPPIMLELLELEDEYDIVCKRLLQLQNV